MPTFKSLKQLEKYAKQKVESAVKSPLVDAVFSQAMQDSVEVEVYSYYQAQEYQNRYDKGGLSDMSNMQFTSHKTNGNTVVSNFENLTVGVDSMNGQYISEVIENGSTTAWATPDGAWADPRPFTKATADRLNNSEYNGYLKVVLETEINS